MPGLNVAEPPLLPPVTLPAPTPTCCHHSPQPSDYSSSCLHSAAPGGPERARSLNAPTSGLCAQGLLRDPLSCTSPAQGVKFPPPYLRERGEMTSALPLILTLHGAFTRCSSDQISRSVMSVSLRLHESQHARPVHRHLPEFTQAHVHRVGAGTMLICVAGLSRRILDHVL